MRAVLIEMVRPRLIERRDAALASVRLSERELRERIESDLATPDERDAWNEIDTVNFLLGGCGVEQ